MRTPAHFRRRQGADHIGWTEANPARILRALYTILLGNPRAYNCRSPFLFDRVKKLHLAPGRLPRCRCAGATALVGEGGDLAETVLLRACAIARQHTLGPARASCR